MIRLKQAVIVEGKYDKIKLSSLLDAVIITTDGFGIFKDKEKLALIRTLAKSSGLVILTDSDSAGFKIRNHIKGCITEGEIINVFVPQIKGKEKRKEKPSAEGYLGVEGLNADILRKALSNAGVMSESSEKKDFLDRARLMDDGLIGGENSSHKRALLLKELGLPDLVNTSTLLEIINRLYSEDAYIKAIEKVNNERN
ncbi:MAG: DUF4093 domain-containing protein [Ruminiclostridium sp.]|nr:DUF4093 domain-containing protein [Ruminiclostridium sp.]